MNENSTDNKSVKKEVSLTKQSNLRGDIIIPSDPEKQFEFFTRIVKSKNIGVKTAEDAMAIYIQANELGLGWASASNHMFHVNGKTGVDIHIIRALLLRKGTGITWKKIEDHKVLYLYADSKGNTYTEDTFPAKSAIAHSKEEYDLATKDGLLPLYIKPNSQNKIVPYDYRTTYEFSRVKQMPDGKWITQIERSSFSWQEALKAELPMDGGGELNKFSPWQKYRKLMIDTRAFVFGARAIGADLLLGVYETSELYDMNDIDYEVMEDGSVHKK